MIIQCSACQTRFRLADEKLKPQGVKVRCTHCNEIFTVLPPATAVPEPPAAPLTAPSPPAFRSGPDCASPDLNFSADPALPSSSAPTVADDGFDFGEFNMEDLGEPNPAAESLAASELDGSEEFEFPEMDEADQRGPQAQVREVVPGDLPPLEDFDLDDSGFAGFDQGSDTEPAGDRSGEPIFEDEPAIGGDLGEIFEDESFGKQLPEIDDSFTGGPQEFSFDEEPGGSFPGESASANPGPAEFSFADDAPGENSVAAPDSLTSGAGSEFLFEGPDDVHQNDEVFAEFDFDSPKPPPDRPASGSPTEKAAPKTTKPAPSRFAGPTAAAPRPAIRRKSQKTKPRKEINHRRGPLLFLLFLLVLAGGYGYFGWKQGVYDPAILIEQARSMIQGQAIPDQIGLIEIRHLRNQFVSNQSAGQLFVVHGEAVNRFNGARSAISVKGMIYDKNGKAILQQTVFCGNPLDEAALRTLPYAKIEESMNNQFGDALSNLNLAPDQTISFTIVFRNLPAEIAQFNVEVADSRPGTK
jgi:predicted Zn finger-like uncharacterized protein